MATTFIRSTSPIGGNVVQKTTIVDGVTTVTITSETDASRKADIVSAVAYRTHKVWNPTTQVWDTVTMTGDAAQDAVLMTAAFNVAGVRSDQLISLT